MTAALDNLSLTLAQSKEQRVLRVVEIRYAYSLHNPADRSRQDPESPFVVAIDILGDDVLTDDLLARSVDAHEVHCQAGSQVRLERSLTVAQGLLDEDIGDDEIKLQIKVSRANTLITQATTEVVRGKF